MPSGKGKKSSNRIVLNVGGVRHETFLSTLKTIPDTRLSYLGEHHTSVARSPEYDTSKGEYFFDRHPGVFSQILNFYRTGRLHCPSDVCGPLFEEELGFWGIDEQQVETCCWENYKQHKDKQEKLKYFKLPGFDEDSDRTCQSKDSGLFEDVDEVPSWWSRYQPKVWKSLEEPYTSFWAKLVGIVSLLLFTAYIIKFALSTLEYFNDRSASRYIVLSVIHLVCISWFSMDFALRLLFSPDKRAFIKSPYTWTDLISLVLLYVFFFYPVLDSIAFLEMVVMIKVARIFQLFKFSYVLQVLVNTLKASSSELCLLLVITGFVMVVFASFIYFLERHETDSDFKSVPDSMWWAVITMTTVGYGEVHPRTWIGKTVGSACAIFGVLVIALPVSVVASNFSLFYTYAKARLNLPPKKRRIAFSHALTSMQNQRTQCATEDETNAFNFMPVYSQRQTDHSYLASDVSISCSATPRGSLKKSSFWSLRSVSKLLRPSKRTRVSRSKSLNSVFLDYKTQKKISTEGITLKFDPPSRSPSASDLTRDQRQGSLPAGDKTFLNTPSEKGRTKETAKDFPKTPLLNKSLYPLHLRRGAVSPASFSLKSASTASSLNALPRGYNELCNALSGKGPIIFLSDQGSLQSLCSLHARMTCSCLSVKSTGSDESQGVPHDTNGGNPGGDENFVSSSPAKPENLTLSVPVEYHGKRKKRNGNHQEVEMENAATKTDANVNDQAPQMMKSPGKDESEETIIAERGVNSSQGNVAPCSEMTLLEFSLDNININNSCECQEIRESPVTFENTNEVRQSPVHAQDDLNTAELQVKLPVKPVPVVGRALSAYSLMEYNIREDKLPHDNSQVQKGPMDLANASITNDEPKRRHSAFTPCNSSSMMIKERRGRLSTGCMKEKVAECEPLINETATQLIGDRWDDDEVQNINSIKEQSNAIQPGKRLRKSGLSAYYSPPKFTRVNEDNAVSEIEILTTPKIDENWVRPTSPYTAKGYLPTVANRCSEIEVTSRV